MFRYRNFREHLCVCTMFTMLTDINLHSAVQNSDRAVQHAKLQQSEICMMAEGQTETA